MELYNNFFLDGMKKKATISTSYMNSRDSIVNDNLFCRKASFDVI